jgi:hypothetical protein
LQGRRNWGFLCHLRQGRLYRWIEHSTNFFEKMSTGGEKKAPTITPRGWIFWTIIFYNLKNSHQDLSNEGSNFVFEVGH